MRLPTFRRAADPPYRLPEGLRVYAVGDVHGRDDLLAGMAARIARDHAGRPPVDRALVVFLGDYVDRGPDSRGVIERLSGGDFAGLPVRCLLGNHEEALLRFLADPVGGVAWLDWGGGETLASYGVAVAGVLDDALVRRSAAAFAEALPRRHLRFLQELEVAIELGGFLFVHAGVRPGVALDRQRRADLIGIRAPFLAARRSLGHRVVHGHTVAPAVELLPHRVGVDTGAYASGRLSAVVIEGEAVAAVD